MKILFTGKSDFTYNRVRVLIQGLKKIDGVELFFYPITKRRDFNKNEFLRLQELVDFIYIPPFRHRDVAFVKKMAIRPVIFDPLVSKVLTKADFGQYWKTPFKYFLDKIPFSKCDILIADTLGHKKYFSNTLGIDNDKIHVLPIGVETEIFFNREDSKQNEKFTVGFYGNFVPLQGTDKIIEAAKLLREEKDIVFELIGSGYRFKKAHSMMKKYKLDNLFFRGTLPYHQLNERINSFDVCLGIFGDSYKAEIVIPNKVYHYSAVKKCIITRDTTGIREIFSHGKDIYLCSNQAKDIADTILYLKKHPNVREELAVHSQQLIVNQYNEKEIALKFIDILKNYPR